MSDDLSELIARVEGLEGASAEVDAQIICTLAAPAGSFVERSKINGAWCIYTAPGRLYQMSSGRGGWWRPGGWPVTSSLDSALALVERVLPGWSARIDTGDPSLRHTRPMARLTPHNDNDDGWALGSECRLDTFARTPALALILALLRVLAVKEKDRAE